MVNKITIRQRHAQTAQEFEAWLKQNPFATHGEIFEAFNKIADANYRVEKRKLHERRHRPHIGRV